MLMPCLLWIANNDMDEEKDSHNDHLRGLKCYVIKILEELYIVAL